MLTSTNMDALLSYLVPKHSACHQSGEFQTVSMLQFKMFEEYNSGRRLYPDSAATQREAPSSSPQPGAAVVDPALVKAVTKSVLVVLAKTQPANRKHKDQDTPAQQVQEVVDISVNNITGNGESRQSLSRSASMWTTAAMPAKVKAEIWSREYVQIEELLKETGEPPWCSLWVLRIRLG